MFDLDQMSCCFSSICRANSLNLSNAVPLRHVHQYWYCSCPVVMLLPFTPSLITRIPQRTSRTEAGLFNGLNFHLIWGHCSINGWVLISISVRFRSDLAKMYSMITGLWWWQTKRLSFQPLEKPLWPLVVVSLFECFVAWWWLLRLLLACCNCRWLTSCIAIIRWSNITVHYADCS